MCMPEKNYPQGSMYAWLRVQALIIGLMMVMLH